MDKTWEGFLLSSLFLADCTQDKLSSFMTKFPTLSAHAPWICHKCAEILTCLLPFPLVPYKFLSSSRWPMVERAWNTLVSDAAIPRNPGRIIEPLPAFDERACSLFVGWDDREGRRKHDSILAKDKQLYVKKNYLFSSCRWGRSLGIAKGDVHYLTQAKM